jgi:large subunit ribosomal protein L24
MLIKVNDTVIMLSGRDKGQTGKVIKVDRANNKLIVEGLNKIFKHVKKSQRNPQGGRLSRESFIDASKVRFSADGSKERYSKKSGETISVVSPAKSK